MWAIQSLNSLELSFSNKDKIELDIRYEGCKEIINYSFFLENFSIRELKKVKKLSLYVFYKGKQFKEINIFLTKTGFREIDSTSSYFDLLDLLKERIITTLTNKIRRIFISPWNKSLFLPNEIIFDFGDDIEEIFEETPSFLIKDWEVFDVIDNKKRYWFFGTYTMSYSYDHSLYEDEDTSPLIKVDNDTSLLIWETNLIECNFLSDTFWYPRLYSDGINKIIKIIKKRKEFKLCVFYKKQKYLSFVLDKDFLKQLENINKLFVDKSSRKTIFENKFKNLILFINISQDKQGLEIEIKTPKEIYFPLENNWSIPEWDNYYNFKFIKNKDTNFSFQFRKPTNWQSSSNLEKAKYPSIIFNDFFYHDDWNKRTFLRKKYTWEMVTFLTLENIVSTTFLTTNEDISIFTSVSSNWILYIFDSNWNIKKQHDLNEKISLFRELKINKDNLWCSDFSSNDFEIVLRLAIRHSDINTNNNYYNYISSYKTYLLSINKNFESNVYAVSNIFKCINNLQKETLNFSITKEWEWKSFHFQNSDDKNILIRSNNMPYIKNFSNFETLDIKRLLWRLNAYKRDRTNNILNYWIHWLHDIKRAFKSEKWIDEFDQQILTYLDQRRFFLISYSNNIFQNDFFWRESFDFYLENEEWYFRKLYTNVFKKQNYYFVRQNNLKLFYVASIVQTQ